MWHIETVKSSKNVVRMGVCYYCDYYLRIAGGMLFLPRNIILVKIITISTTHSAFFICANMFLIFKPKA